MLADGRGWDESVTSFQNVACSCSFSRKYQNLGIKPICFSKRISGILGISSHTDVSLVLIIYLMQYKTGPDLLRKCKMAEAVFVHLSLLSMLEIPPFSICCHRTFSHHIEVDQYSDDVGVVVVFVDEDAVEVAAVGPRVVVGDVEHVDGSILDVVALFAPVPVHAVDEVFALDGGHPGAVGVDLGDRDT